MHQQSLAMYDWQAILQILEAVAWVAVLGAALLLGLRAKSVNKQNKQVVLVLFAAWAVASLGHAGVRAYMYYDGTRGVIKEQIERQEQQFGR